MPSVKCALGLIALVADKFRSAVVSPDFGARFAGFVCSINEKRGESLIMPKGDKGKYTDKQKRKAEHIEEGYEDRGVSKKEAKARAWATVNKESGGGKKSGSGRGKKESHASSRKGGKKGGKKSSKKR
jgi:plasmid stabilization system protein ParE